MLAAGRGNQKVALVMGCGERPQIGGHSGHGWERRRDPFRRMFLARGPQAAVPGCWPTSRTQTGPSSAVADQLDERAMAVEHFSSNGVRAHVKEAIRNRYTLVQNRVETLR